MKLRKHFPEWWSIPKARNEAIVAILIIFAAATLFSSLAIAFNR